MITPSLKFQGSGETITIKHEPFSPGGGGGPGGGGRSSSVDDDGGSSSDCSSNSSNSGIDLGSLLSNRAATATAAAATCQQLQQLSQLTPLQPGNSLLLKSQLQPQPQPVQFVRVSEG